MDLNAQMLDETNSLAPADETNGQPEIRTEIAAKQNPTIYSSDEPDFIAGALGIAAVLFPASPPSAVNARFVRGLHFHDDTKKPRGLAGAAGLFESFWDEPDSHAVSAIDPFSRNWS
ncbi:MAG: hypothetical protein JWN13_3129 [Betaproteobacteria bacterium]|jgi:hypothetical protein|nr:hypothetical protein [Betaproteobacteria bacterium]